MKYQMHTLFLDTFTYVCKRMLAAARIRIAVQGWNARCTMPLLVSCTCVLETQNRTMEAR